MRSPSSKLLKDLVRVPDGGVHEGAVVCVFRGCVPGDDEEGRGFPDRVCDVKEIKESTALGQPPQGSLPHSVHARLKSYIRGPAPGLST